MRKLVSLIVVLIIGLVCFVSCSERIDAGHEGMLVRLYGTEKGINDVSLVTGRIWFNPFTTRIYEYPTYVQTYNYDAFTVNAKDGSVFTVDPTLSFKVIDGESPKIFKKYRKTIPEITSITLANYIKDAFRIEFNKYTTDSIISNRETFENAIQSNMGALLKTEGFHLEQMTSGVEYPASITQAINEKNSAIQQAMRVDNELKIAEAQAKILIVQAKAEAEANELKRKSLNDNLIQQQFIEKWDGSSAIFGNSPQFFKPIN